jgi:phosphoglycolate phosphatase
MTQSRAPQGQPEAVLFDKDGTLFDFATTWEAFANAFLMRVTGGETARATALGHQIGFDMASRSFASDSIVIAGTPDEVAGALRPHLPGFGHADLVDLLNLEAAAAPQVEAVPLAPFLDRLRHAGLKLGVATNDAEAPARAHIGSAGVLDRFDFIAGSDSGHGAKPDPGQLLAFCAAVAVVPGRAVMVGDSTHDLIAGRAAGMATVAVLTGMAGPAELSPLADVVLPDIGHLPEWLRLG